MNICCANHGPRLAAPQGNTVKFSNNPQDHDALPNDTVDIPNVSANGGKPSTDSVVLENKKAIFVMGNLVGLRPDPAYKLTPNADGNFVYADNSDKNFNGANAFGAVAETVNKYNQVLGELTGKNIEWAFGDKQIKVSPETGDWPNAFYARQFKGLHFFHYKTTSTAASGEVSSHEAGHAILDSQRPGFMEGSGSETGAYHEAFGDCLSMLMTLGNEKAVEALVAQTEGGDLSTRRNMLSDMGEAFGHALGREGGIRTSKNEFVYADPASLPEHGDENHLGREVHDFSRLWSGAFYDVIDGISDANRAAGMAPKEALMAAGEECWKLLVGQVELSPKASETTFHEMAANMAAADAQFNGGARGELIKNVMVKRGLMDADAPPPSRQNGARLFNAEPVRQEFFIGNDAGQLAGVKMSSLVDQPAFGLVGLTNSTIAEAEKGARLLAADGEVLFTDKTNPDLGDIFRPDGTAYAAYVAPNAKGEREFHRTKIVF
ncbi:MAG: hypothetical protein KF760_09540 [Candidatus Eremiobacteraeota bacterium]|nr:hypothetical protein [Candidatus Eremiobacteraeota bacterium]